MDGGEIKDKKIHSSFQQAVPRQILKIERMSNESFHPRGSITVQVGTCTKRKEGNCEWNVESSNVFKSSGYK